MQSMKATKAFTSSVHCTGVPKLSHTQQPTKSSHHRSSRGFVRSVEASASIIYIEPFDAKLIWLYAAGTF
eukprot:scaffold339993_cov17-Prasinocladus_malaysianus.AAC.1